MQKATLKRNRKRKIRNKKLNEAPVKMSLFKIAATIYPKEYFDQEKQQIVKLHKAYYRRKDNTIVPIYYYFEKQKKCTFVPSTFKL